MKEEKPDDEKLINAGDLFALESSGLVNLTERLRTADRKSVVNALDPATTISYTPDDVNAVVTVFPMYPAGRVVSCTPTSTS